MKFEYEPYHIGSKIKFYVDKANLISKLQNFYREKMSEYEINPNVFSRENILAPTITVMANDIDNVFIQFNLSGNALNVIGNEPNNVYNSYETLINTLPEIGYDLKSTFSFYEIITNIRLSVPLRM